MTDGSGAGSLRQIVDPGHGRGLAFMLAGIAVLTAMDAGVKALTVRYSVPEIAFFRCLLALPFLLAALRWQGGLGALRSAQPRMQVVRGLFAAATGLSFFHALALLPLADTIALSFAAPFLIAALSAPLLGEAVSRRSWFAIVLGFLGVVIVVRPGSGVGAGTALALAAAASYAIASLLLRRLGRSDAAITTALWSTVVSGLVYAALAVPGWESPAPADWPLLILVGLSGAVGLVAVSNAYRLVPAAVLGALEYTALVWGVVLGFLAFGDLPAPPVIAGSAVIVLSGVLLVRASR